MKKEITLKYGWEIIKAGVVVEIIFLTLGIIFNDSALVWSGMFPLTIGFMLISTSQ